MKKEIKFKECIVKPLGEKWGVFTIESQNQKGYIWFVKEMNEKSCTLVPTWTDRFKNEIKGSSKEDCLALAKAYDDFVYNSECC